MKYLTNMQPGKELRSRRFLAMQPLASIALAGFFAAGMVLQAQTDAGKAASGLINPRAVVFNSATGKVYTVDTGGGVVDISNDAANTTVQVKVGVGPVSIAVDSRNGRAFVANTGDGTVSVIDGKTDTVIATIPIGAHPYSIDADSAAGKVYVSRTYSDQLTIIDATTNQVTDVKTGSPDLIAVDARRNTAYLLGYEGGDLVIFDGGAQKFTKTTVGMHAWGMALNEQTGVLYVARPGDAAVAMLEHGSTSPEMIPAGAIPCSVAVNTRTNMVYAVNYGDDTLTVIDGAKSHAAATLPVGKRPQAVAVDAERDLVFVANTQGNSVTVIDGKSNRVLTTLNAGKAPYAVAVNPMSRKLHVANLIGMPYTIIDVNHLR
jgi:YVTN family beta-propeller protein